MLVSLTNCRTCSGSAAISSPHRKSATACGAGQHTDGAIAVLCVRGQVDRDDPDQCGPPTGDVGDLRQLLGCEFATVLGEHGGDLRGVEGQRAGPEPGDAAVEFQRLPADRRLEPTAQHYLQKRRSVPDHVLEAGQHQRVGEQVRIVDNQDPRPGAGRHRGEQLFGCRGRTGRFARRAGRVESEAVAQAMPPPVGVVQLGGDGHPHRWTGDVIGQGMMSSQHRLPAPRGRADQQRAGAARSEEVLELGVGRGPGDQWESEDRNVADPRAVGRSDAAVHE
ncbi:hypothetical protein [Nocardia farcinica]|uniref:hypothetical protein n=1 Tax=Nocardia farcinica TaxID=37329 RepID=UPI001894D683|nr:hypothetical protein [Nocardia farcinica]MBF6520257.1 hypothetical protein [Nocardia farcinica]